MIGELIKIIYKTKDYLIIDKPAGMLTYPGGVAAWLLRHYPQVKNVGDNPQERPGIVHRLDKATSGLMIVCLTNESFQYFKQQFKDRKIKKTYLAVVWGKPSGIKGSSKWTKIQKPIGLKMGTTKHTVFNKKAKMVKEAITEYKVLQTFSKRGQFFSLLKVVPLTGRTHQIRVHLASSGYPIVGDDIYGRNKNKQFLSKAHKRLLLHAYTLEFTDINGQRVKVESEPPQSFTVFANEVLK